MLNSGTLIGPSAMMLSYFQLMVQEMEQRWHCRRLHGSDQAIHNYLVYTGKLIGTGKRPASPANVNWVWGGGGQTLW